MTLNEFKERIDMAIRKGYGGREVNFYCRNRYCDSVQLTEDIDTDFWTTPNTGLIVLTIEENPKA